MSSDEIADLPPDEGDAIRRSDERYDATTKRAIHLAAHAVAADACGLPFPALSLDDAACPLIRGDGGSGRGPARNALEAAVIVALAGAEAEAIATGTHPSCCVDVSSWVTDGDNTEAEPFIEWLRLKAARTVEHPLRQRLINSIARALVEAGELARSEVQAIAMSEVSSYMRGQ